LWDFYYRRLIFVVFLPQIREGQVVRPVADLQNCINNK